MSTLPLILSTWLAFLLWYFHERKCFQCPICYGRGRSQRLDGILAVQLIKVIVPFINFAQEEMENALKKSKTRTMWICFMPRLIFIMLISNLEFIMACFPFVGKNKPEIMTESAKRKVSSETSVVWISWHIKVTVVAY